MNSDDCLLAVETSLLGLLRIGSRQSLHESNEELELAFKQQQQQQQQEVACWEVSNESLRFFSMRAFLSMFIDFLSFKFVGFKT